MTRHDIEELVANEIYDKLTILLNDTRKIFGIQKGRPIDPLRKYDNFKLSEDGELTYVYKRTVIDLGNINERLKAPWEICKLGVAKLRSMGFTNITDEDVQPHRARYIKARKKVRILNEDLNERSKAIESPSTTDAEAIEMIEMTSKDKDIDKQLRTIKGSLNVAIAKRVDLKDRIEHERKLTEVQDPTYSDDQRNMSENRIKRLRDELNERNKEIDILEGEASKQINQIKESITKFLDKEMGTLGERIRTLFKEQV